MKIKDEHYAELKKHIEAQVQANPEFELMAQLSGHRPERARWDVLWRTGMKIGDGVGTFDPQDGTPFLPLYSYMNDDHIDTALRSIMKELGKDYAASSNNVHVSPVSFDPATRVMQGDNFKAMLVDQSSGAETVCLVAKNGALLLDTAVREAQQANPGNFAVKDVDGGLHAVAMEGSAGAYIKDYQRFFVSQSEYVVQPSEVIYGPGAGPETPPLAVIEDEQQTFTFAQLQQAAERMGTNEYGGVLLIAEQKDRPDGSASTQFMKVNTVNGVGEYIESEVAALGEQLGHKMAPEFEPELRLKGPRMG
jgi:hypothetical protein